MPAVASLEELNAVSDDLAALKGRHPEAYAEVADLLRRHRQVGYKNICRLLLGEATPEKLKGVD
jgi:hypothetical protein